MILVTREPSGVDFERATSSLYDETNVTRDLDFQLRRINVGDHRSPYDFRYDEDSNVRD